MPRHPYDPFGPFAPWDRIGPWGRRAPRPVPVTREPVAPVPVTPARAPQRPAPRAEETRRPLRPVPSAGDPRRPAPLAGDPRRPAPVAAEEARPAPVRVLHPIDEGAIDKDPIEAGAPRPEPAASRGADSGARDHAKAARRAEAERADSLHAGGASAAGDALTRARDRIERDAERRIELERRAVLRDFIEVVDDLDRALGAAGEDDLTEGVRLVHARFLDKLARHGARRADVDLGERFDPASQEAIGAVDAGPDRAGRVIDVLRPAYFVGDELLRPAQVVVGR